MYCKFFFIDLKKNYNIALILLDTIEERVDLISPSFNVGSVWRYDASFDARAEVASH